MHSASTIGTNVCPVSVSEYSVFGETQIDALELNMDDIDDMRRDTSMAAYVWLPLRFEGEMAYIDWQDEWRWEDFCAED